METGDVRGLADQLSGELLQPGDAEYEQARHVWNGLIDRRPALIVRCAHERDVVAAVNFARDRGLELAVRGGGHNVAGRALVEGGLVVDLSRMRRVRIDASGDSVRSQGGATLKDVDDTTLPRGRVTPLGLVGETGLAGFTLHGGYGWLARRFGLSADNLISARVVTADGRLIEASEQTNPELLWALRGGGGNFGVVTEFEHRLHALTEPVWMGLLIYPLEDSDGIMRLFRDYMSNAPEELTGLTTYWTAPAIPQIPTGFHGVPCLFVVLVHSGEAREAERAITTFREFGQPIADLSKQVPFATAQRFFDEDYPPGRCYYWKSAYLPELPDELIPRLHVYAAQRPSELSTIDVWGLGGAVSRVAEDATAFAHRNYPFLCGIEANFTAREQAAENIAWTRELFREAKVYARGASYLNFPGFVEEGDEQIRSAYGVNYRRLQRVKEKFDPHNLFHGNFNIPPHP